MADVYRRGVEIILEYFLDMLFRPLGMLSWPRVCSDWGASLLSCTRKHADITHEEVGI